MNTDPRRTRLILISVVTVCALLAPTPAAAEPDGSPGAPAASRDESGLSAAAVATAERADQHGVALQPAVLTELDTQGVADFWVGFSERADLAGAAEISGWAARGRYVHRRLVETAQASQAELITRLRLAGVQFEPFWIANTVLVRGADQAVLDGVVAQPGVVEVRADRVVALPDPIRPEAGGEAAVAAVEWGIANIRADRVWSELGARGEGIVVGSIDTGVEFTHPALVDQYRGNVGDGVFDHDYQWWDPAGVCPDPQPCDNNDHGTHTTGTMVGDGGAGNEVGVAPAAQWIAAKGCEARNCSAGALLSSGQFMLAPTNLAGGDPRPELRPHVINNSWSGAGGDPWYDQMVAAWVAAGIFPAFANGNAGPGCGTAGAPADGPDAYAVGAYDAAGLIAGFSSRGPGRDGEVRPDISAPGVSVRSAVRGGGYGVGSGTSMATPHLAGTVALMWSASGLVGDIPTTRAALDATAVDTEDLSCGGTAADNNVYGQGRLDALASTLEVSVNSGITGTVSDANSEQPLSGVRVQGTGNRESTTDDAGSYTLRLVPGQYTVAFSRFGYPTRTVPGVVVDEAGFTTVDVGLEPLPTGRVTGNVTDLASGHTIPGAAVEVLDVPLPFQATTGADGTFQLPPLPVGTYRIQTTTSRPGLWWPPEATEVTVTAGEAAEVEIRWPRAEGAERVSVSSDGRQASRSSTLGPAAISTDGRYVSFRSAAPNLVDSPLPQEANVYVHDRRTGVTELVPGAFYHASLTGDGRYAAYAGPAGQVAERQPDLPPLPRYWPDLTDRAYVLDRTTGQLVLASANGAGETVGTLPATEPAITPDGRFVAYDSNAPQLVDGDRPRFEQNSFFELRHAMTFQVVVHDQLTGSSEIVSVSNDGALDNSWAGKEVALSPDARYVAFRSLATNLVAEPTNPGYDIFVRDRVTGATEWVSRLETPGGFFTEIARPIISDNGEVVLYNRGIGLAGRYHRATGESAALSVPLADVPHVFTFSAAVAVSGDGRRVTFVQVTSADETLQTVVPEATGVFVLDLDTGAHSKLRGIDWNGLEDAGFVPSQLSRDGRFGLGDTNSDDLVPGDTNGVDDVYVVDLAHEPDRPEPRFAVWDLSVAPTVPRPGEPVEVTVRVKNVGDIAGAYEAALLVDDVREAGVTGTVSLAPGESADVTVPVVRDAGGAYRVRIGQAAGEFRVQAGTLAGHVTDANDGAPIDGATVTATSGGTTRTTTTTLGGTYQLDDLQVGTWEVRVDAGSYLTEPAQVALTEDGLRVTHDVALHTGVLGVDRTGVAVTLPAGATGTVEIGLSNPGSADLAWDAYAWEATTLAQPSVLMYTSAGITDTYVDQALGRLGLDYTAFREDGGCDLSPPWDGIDRFGEALRAGDWDLAIVDHSCAFAELSPATAEALEDQILRGGALIIHSVQIRKDPQLPVWETLGLRFVTTLPGGHGPYAAYWWNGDHPLFTTPLTVPAFAGQGNDMVDAIGGSQALAGYTLTARPDHAALVLGNDGRTLYQGFRPQQPADLDGNGVPDGVQLWVNSIAEVGGLAAQPWLTVTDSGELRPDQSATVPVSIDASRLAPGSYHGTVTLATDAGLEPQVAVPVTLTVTPSPECDRTITGTHRGPIVITSGITCLVDGARIVGPVSVRPGAGLIATGASVTGAVLATGATIVDLRENSLTGPVRLASGTGLVRVSANQITGPISLVHNHTGQDPIVVSGNRIVGPLSCVGNQPPPVNQGIPNTGTGPRAGQCVGL